MYSSLPLLIMVSVLAGFFMRPLNELVFGKLISLEKYLDSKHLVIALMFVSIFTTFFVTISSIYLSLKLAGFIPLGEKTPVFVVAFFVGGTFWVIYARKTNRVCRIDQ